MRRKAAPGRGEPAGFVLKARRAARGRVGVETDRSRAVLVGQPVRIRAHQPCRMLPACSIAFPHRRSHSGYSSPSWIRILNPGFQEGSRLNPKYVPRARDCCVIELIPLPFQICDRIFQRVTSDSIKCNGSFVRSLYGRICRGGQGGDREIARDRGWLRGVVEGGGLVGKG